MSKLCFDAENVLEQWGKDFKACRQNLEVRKCEFLLSMSNFHKPLGPVIAFIEYCSGWELILECLHNASEAY